MAKIQTSFKTNVLNQLFLGAQEYKSVFLDYEYQFFSNDFKLQLFYVISATKSNFLHLTGLNTSLSAEEFFNRAFNKTLVENDFDFVKKNQTESVVKGSVRRKVKFLPILGTIFTNNPVAEENFSKNKIFCNLATSENSFTLGFITTPNARPKTLLKGNELSNVCIINKILRRKKGSKAFNEIIFVK